MTKNECLKVIENLDDIYKLMSKAIYGGGLCLTECIRLRIQDVDFERQVLTIRGGKGNKDRETLFPSISIEELKFHIETIKEFYELDRSNETSLE